MSLVTWCAGGGCGRDDHGALLLLGRGGGGRAGGGGVASSPRPGNLHDETHGGCGSHRITALGAAPL